MNVWGPTLGQRRESTAAPDYFSSSSKTADEPPTPTTKHTPTPATSNTLANSSDPALTTSTPSSGTSTPHPTTGTDTASRKPLYIREGGSIPSIRFLEKEFNAPAAHLPCGQASDSAHLDNERLRLVNLYNSKKIFKEVFRELPKR
ncbi:PAT1 multi-domain protein [Pyrenophora tritici-repentis]|nr:PAT1 multi-domain protein [Pyrenophora tritici-repentis]